MKSICCIFLIHMVVIFSTICQAQTITIAADPWPPYNGIAGSAEPGYGIELAKKIYGEAGYEIIYINIPWARAVPETRQGNFNAIIGANIEDAPDFIFPEEEFGISKRALWALKGTAWRFNGMDSLKSVKIGAIQDYSYGKQFNDFFRKNKNLVDYVHGENALLLNISKLLTGRINVIIENRNVFLYTVKKLGVSDRIINVGSEVSSDKVYIAFSPGIKESKKYAAIFTRGIRKMQQNGDLKKILEKYGLEYWK